MLQKHNVTLHILLSSALLYNILHYSLVMDKEVYALVSYILGKVNDSRQRLRRYVLQTWALTAIIT